MKWHVINSIVRMKCGKIRRFYFVLILLVLIMHPLLCQEQVLQEGKVSDEDLERQGK